MTDTDDVPPGYEPHFRQSAVTDPWEPLFSKRDGRAFCLGLRIAEPHCNGRGFLHGGVISALADNALGLSCVLQSEGSGAVTVQLSTEFLAAGGRGQWLEVRAEPHKLGRSLAFAGADITADGDSIARASAVFKMSERRPA